MEDNEENYLRQYMMSSEVIRDTKRMSNLEYSITGEAFSYTTDTSLKIFAAVTPTPILKNVISAKIDLMKYFQRYTLLHTTKEKIFYLSVYDNKYLRTFEGHKDNITCLSVNSNQDTFMSICDKTVKLWDIRHKDPVYEIESEGRIGALSRDKEYALVDNGFLYIFDWRNPRGPMATRNIRPGFHKKICYTGDGTCICVSTLKNHQFLDSSGEFISYFQLENSCDGDILNESNIFLCGSAKLLFGYKIADKKIIGRSTFTDLDCEIVRANPSHAQFLCASKNDLKMWSLPIN